MTAITQGVSPTRKQINTHGPEQWAEYCHTDDTRGSETAETKVLKHEPGYF
jgi:hypothetical protein